MPIAIQWDNPEKTILRYDLQGRWTWDEFYVAYDQAKAMMETVSHRVHFIMLPLDAATRNYLPPGALTHIMSIYRKEAANSGATVTIGGGGFARAMMSILKRIAPSIADHFSFADSLEEARAILAKKMEARA